jgi:putative toxin-antitoxin system antitoxin component (TIGR02293 family)
LAQRQQRFAGVGAELEFDRFEYLQETGCYLETIDSMSTAVIRNRKSGAVIDSGGKPIIYSIVKYLKWFIGGVSLSQMKQKPISYWDYLPQEETLVVKEAEVAYMVNKVRSGLPLAEFYAMRDTLAVTEERLGGLLGLSRATLHRRKKTGYLDRTESDRLIRYARLVSLASEALGGIAGARSWLLAPAYAFHGECPLDFADTEVGAREVEALLGRIEHGVFS